MSTQSEEVINLVKQMIGFPQEDIDQTVEDKSITDCIIAMDSKDAIDISTEDAGITPIGSPTGKSVLKLLDVYLHEYNFEEDETAQNTAEYFFEHIDDAMFFRFKNTQHLNSLDDVLKAVRTFSFWSPIYVMLNGVWHDTYGIDTTDADGKTVGIRF